MRDDYYKFVRRDIEPLLPAAAKRVLDVGAGVGGTSRWLKARYADAYCIALEGNRDLVDSLRQNVDEAHIVDLNGPLPDVGPVDLILFLDVLEHLLDPEKVLAELTRRMLAGGTVIVSLPNVAHLSVSFPLLLTGSFEYRDAGILDRTHLRFFTRKTAVELVNKAGLTVTQGLRTGLFGPRSRVIDGLTFGAVRDHLTKQYVMACRRTTATEKQGDIRWGLAGLSATGAELDLTI
jgi:2-polyprenyl-3-methyl-5-hydroxy-6-metoxy-1,4-benzoquinol methylase